MTMEISLADSIKIIPRRELKMDSEGKSKSVFSLEAPYELTKAEIKSDPIIKNLYNNYEKDLSDLKNNKTFKIAGSVWLATAATLMAGLYACLNTGGTKYTVLTCLGTSAVSGIIIGLINRTQNKKIEACEEKYATLIKERIGNIPVELAAEALEKEHQEEAARIAREKAENIFTSIKDLKPEVAQDIGKILYKNNFKNIDYAKAEKDIYEIFCKNNSNQDLNLKLGKIDDDTFVGMLSKINKNGTSSLYLVKIEYFDCVNSKKIKVSKVQIVQDGIEDNSDIKRKEIKPRTVTTGSEKSTYNGVVYGNDSKNTNSNLKIGFSRVKNNTNSTQNSSERMTSKEIRTYNQVISEIEPEGKEITIYSL